MKICVIVSMEKEMNILLHLIANPTTITLNDFNFHRGIIGGHDIIAMKCGIGKVNAAIGTLTMIDNFHPALIINTGVAGGAGGGAGILDVVIGEKVAYHDTYCGPGTEWGEAAGCPRYFCPPQALLDMELINEIGAKKGLICSGDIFVSRPEELARIKEIHPEVMAVDMESAAIAQVCHVKGVPFISIRVISDTPGEVDNISQYESFWEDAPHHTFELLSSMLKAL